MQDYQICFHDIFYGPHVRISDLHTLARDNLSHGFCNKTELLVPSSEGQKIVSPVK